MEKGQTAKHEWVYHGVIGERRCPHCNNKRKKDKNGNWVYQCDAGLDWGPMKPPCITRKTQADGEV